MKDLTGTLREGMAEARIKTHGGAVLRAAEGAAAFGLALFSSFDLPGKIGFFVGLMFLFGIIESIIKRLRPKKIPLNESGRKALRQYFKDANAAVEIFTKDGDRLRRYHDLSPEAKRIVDETIRAKEASK